MTTSSERDSETTQSNSIYAEDEQAAGDEQVAVKDEQAAWRDLAVAAGKGFLKDATLQTVFDLTNQLRQQNADVRLKDADIRFKDSEIRHKDREQELEKAKWEAEVQAEKAEREAQIQAEKAEWEAQAQAETTADKFRSGVLVLVVLAVVATPIYAMSRPHLQPSQFLQFVAPITAIAGTVLGYWFGQQDRSPRHRVRKTR